jgi:hypothetical protein
MHANVQNEYQAMHRSNVYTRSFRDVAVAHYDPVSCNPIENQITWVMLTRLYEMVVGIRINERCMTEKGAHCPQFVPGAWS